MNLEKESVDKWEGSWNRKIYSSSFGDFTASVPKSHPAAHSAPTPSLHQHDGSENQKSESKETCGLRDSLKSEGKIKNPANKTKWCKGSKSHKQTNVQVFSEQPPTWKTPVSPFLPLPPVFIAVHDAVWYRISLWPVQVSDLHCVLPSTNFLPTLGLLTEGRWGQSGK